MSGRKSSSLSPPLWIFVDLLALLDHSIVPRGEGGKCTRLMKHCPGCDGKCKSIHLEYHALGMMIQEQIGGRCKDMELSLI